MSAWTDGSGFRSSVPSKCGTAAASPCVPSAAGDMSSGRRRRRCGPAYCVRLVLKAALVVSASIAGTGLMLAIVSAMSGGEYQLEEGYEEGVERAQQRQPRWVDTFGVRYETLGPDLVTSGTALATTKLKPVAAATPVASTMSILSEPGGIATQTTELTQSTQTASTALSNEVINPHPFKMIHNPSGACSGRRSDVFILAIVHSAPSNIKRRMVVRDTWASNEHYDRVKTVVLFALGARTAEPAVMKMVAAESARFGDIIQEDFEDSYKNLTYKGVMWLGWAAEHCKQARYVLKVDDDIFVNIFNLAAHLSAIYKRPAAVTGGSRSRTVLCLLWTRMPVQRDPKNKWFVSKDDWAEDYFTRYCSGSAYILTRDLVPGMYENSFRTKFFWVDDFYVTGLLIRPLNASYISLSSLYVLKKAEMHERLVDGYAIFGHIPGSMNSRYSLWKEVLTARGLLSQHTH